MTIQKDEVAPIEQYTSEERRTLIENVRRFGNSTSDAILEPNCKFFKIPDLEGIIGYQVASNCVVVFGDPLCDWSHTAEFVEAFHANCQKNDLKVVYLNASEKFAKWAIHKSCKALVEFGEELVMDPHCDPRARTGGNARVVRRKVNHALKEGIVVHEYTTNDPLLEKAMLQVGEDWLNARKGPQVHISQLRLFENRPGKRWFYAMQGNRMVGIVLLNQLQAREGWLLNHLMHIPKAPNGTPELLLTSALDIVANEGCHFVTFGTVPAAKLGEIIGLSNFSGWFWQMSFRVIYRVFRLAGLKRFWEKFHPESERAYLLFSEPSISMQEIRALIRALNIRIL